MILREDVAFAWFKVAGRGTARQPAQIDWALRAAQLDTLQRL